jgi:NAD(P)-dependent dehydrogenase (short-subunit alcohol dehydrogenase family)
MSNDEKILDVKQRVVMISGASRGIGAAIADKLLQDGYRVSLGVRDVTKTRARFAESADQQLLVEHFDATVAESAQAWFDKTVRHFGTLHALVNNAGIWRQVNFESEGEDELDELWEVNVKGPFRLTKLALPLLRQCGSGRIVNIASTDGVRFRDNSCSVGYTMSKHALVAMSHAARNSGYEDGVRVTALCPGAVATDLIAGLPGVTPRSQQLSPDTVAHVVAMLLSLPNNASVSWMPLNTRVESTI